jgi:hypothetical protein
VWIVVALEDESMPRIIVNAFLTLDGVVQALERAGKPEYGQIGS